MLYRKGLLLEILLMSRHVKLEAGAGGGRRLEVTLWSREAHYRNSTVAHPSESTCELFAIHDRA